MIDINPVGLYILLISPTIIVAVLGIAGIWLRR